jgi:hypothetical protein
MWLSLIPLLSRTRIFFPWDSGTLSDCSDCPGDEIGLERHDAETDNYVTNLNRYTENYLKHQVSVFTLTPLLPLAYVIYVSHIQPGGAGIAGNNSKQVFSKGRRRCFPQFG